MKSFVLAAAFLVAASGAAGSDGDAMRGQGVMPCTDYTSNYTGSADTTDLMVYTWALGFMTGANSMAIQSGHGKFRDLSGRAEAHEAHLRAYCRAHPKAEIIDAVVDLYRSLPAKAL